VKEQLAIIVRGWAIRQQRAILYAHGKVVWLNLEYLLMLAKIVPLMREREEKVLHL
jgi:hypothetical protein